jgi:hypothetical protein
VFPTDCQSTAAQVVGVASRITAAIAGQPSKIKASTANGGIENRLAACRRDEHEPKPQRGRVRAGVEADNQETGGGKHQGDDLEEGDSFAGQPHGEADGEHHLDLDDERGEPRRNIAVHGDVEQAELPQPNEDAIGSQRAPRHDRPLDEERGGQEGKGEPERGEQQRRQMPERQLNHHEVRPPHRDHGEGEQEVAERERGR